jgi:hypothetical protein
MRPSLRTPNATVSSTKAGNALKMTNSQVYHAKLHSRLSQSTTKMVPTKCRNTSEPSTPPGPAFVSSVQGVREQSCAPAGIRASFTHTSVRVHVSRWEQSELGEGGAAHIGCSR